MLLNRVHERAKQIACAAHPTGQGGARYLNSLSGVDLRLPVQRQMVAELRDDHMGKQAWARKSALDRARRSWCLDDAIATGAGELRPHVADDLEAVGDVLELFRDILSELA